jgi:Uma2 family endonuclease
MATATVSARAPQPFSGWTIYGDGRLCVRIPCTAATLAGFREWVKSDGFPEKVRVTYVDGEIYYDMSNEELETHNKAKLEILRVLANLNRRLKMGAFYGDGVLLTNVQADVSNNPDGTFIGRASLQSDRIRLVPRKGTEDHYIEIEGTPDMVLEVVSDDSVRKDTRQLLAAYHKAGIPEYWLIDARRKEISFQILHWQEDGYEAGSTVDWQTSRIFKRDFRLLRRRDDMGLWEYTLQVRPGPAGRKRKR